MDAADYFAIQNLVHSYPYALDRGDLDCVGQLFAHAAVYNGPHLMADHDPAAVTAAFRDWLLLYADGTPRTRHYLTNLIIEPDGPECASVKSYVVVLQQTDDLPLQPVIAGDYADRVTKIDGRWRFVERRMGTDLIGDLHAHGRDISVITPSRANNDPPQYVDQPE